MDTVTFFEVNSVLRPSDAWGRTATPIEGTKKGAVNGLYTANTNSKDQRGKLKELVPVHLWEN